MRQTQHYETNHQRHQAPPQGQPVQSTYAQNTFVQTVAAKGAPPQAGQSQLHYSNMAAAYSAHSQNVPPNPAQPQGTTPQSAQSWDESLKAYKRSLKRNTSTSILAMVLLLAFIALIVLGMAGPFLGLSGEGFLADMAVYGPLLIPAGVVCGLLGMLVLFLGVLRGYGNAKAQAALAYRQQVVLPELRAIFQNPTFHPRPLVPTAVLYSSCLFGRFGRPFQTNDWLTGVYRGHRFTTADLRTGEISYNTKGKTWHSDETRSQFLSHTYQKHPPRFHGRWLSFQANKPLQGHVVLWSKGFQDLGSRRSIGVGGHFQRIQLDNATFNNMFDVFASNSHDAFRLLTPHMLETLASLVQGLRGYSVARGVALAAAGNQIDVAVYGAADAFELSDQPRLNEGDAARARVRYEAAVITTVINALPHAIQ